MKAFVLLCSAFGAAAYNYPWQDPTLPTAVRVQNLISLLNITEKVLLLQAASAAIDRIGLPAYTWSRECERGDTSGKTGTSFPSGIALGMTWNASLVNQVAHYTAIEARANYDQGDGGASCFGPVTNFIRDPRWGRTNEMLGGEDTTLATVLGVAFTRGIQAGTAAGAGTHYRMINTIAKHLSAYSGPEGYCGGVTFATQSRFSNTATMSERDWREFYLPPWRAMAVDAQVSGFMSSYQAVNLVGDGPVGPPSAHTGAVGIPDTANPTLLTTILRQTWNWTNGYILSDAGAVAFVGSVDWQGTTIGHGYAANASDAAARALLAGMDIELTCCQLPSVFPTLAASVANGVVPEAALDVSLGRTLPYRFDLGTLDPPGYSPYSNLTAANVSTPAMIQLAQEAAEQAIVLLKNDASVLPLSPAALAGKTIAVFGVSAADVLAQQGGYVNQHPPFIRTPVEGLTDAFPLSSIQYEPGCDTIACSTVTTSAVAALAGVADVSVVVLGTTVFTNIPAYPCSGDNVAIEAEGWDRSNASLPGLQLQLLQAVADAAAGKPVILVTINAGMLDLSWAASSPSIPSILHAPFLGMTSGSAIGAVLAGQANPSGRLTHTWYTAEGLGSIGDITDYRMRPEADGFPGRTYRYYTGASVQYPFGCGLSFTTYSYSNLRVQPASPGPCDNVTLTVSVSNTGPMAGAEVVQAYISMPSSSVSTPIRALVDFSKVLLQPGQAQDVSLTVTPRLQSILRAGDYADVVEPGPRSVWVGGASAPGWAGGVGGGYAVQGQTTPLAQC